MEILEAYDLTGGLRAAAALAGCDHKTVAHYVALREAGKSPDDRLRRPTAIDPFLDKVEEWVDRSRGNIRADVVHDKLVAMGFTGSERTARRAVAAAKKAWRAGNRRVFRPWSLTLPLATVRRLEASNRVAYMIRRDRGFLGSFVVASPTLRNDLEARWLVAQLRRGLAQAGWVEER